MLEAIIIAAMLSFGVATTGELTENGNDKEARIEKAIARSVKKIERAQKKLDDPINDTVTPKDMQRKHRKVAKKQAKYQFQLAKKALRDQYKNSVSLYQSVTLYSVNNLQVKK